MKSTTETKSPQKPEQRRCMACTVTVPVDPDRATCATCGGVDWAPAPQPEPEAR